VHVVLIGGMLLQGCKDTKESAIQPATDTTSTAPATNTDTLPPVTTTANISNAAPGNPAPNLAQNPTPAAPPQPIPAAVPVAPPQPVPAAPPVAPAASTETREYVIASGDTLGALAKKNGISLKTMMAANPGVDPKKLKVGQKVQIPAGASAASPGTPDMAAAGDSATYTVKSGDTLGKIAKINHTSYKKIMALNDLKTTSIKVGQKLKLPAPKEGAETPAASTPVVPLQPSTPAASSSVATAPSTTASN